MTSAVLAILVLAAIMAATVLVSIVVMRRVGARAESSADDLRDEVERLGERWIVPLSGASEQGARRGRSAGHGVLGLTGRRVVFQPIAGERVSVPLARVAGARLEARRRDALSDHRYLLRLTLDDGSGVEFLIDDPGVWERGLVEAGLAAGGGAT